MKLTLISVSTILILFSLTAGAVKKMDLASRQGRKISQLYADLGKGENEKVLAECLAEIKSFGKKALSTFSDLPYRLALAEVALFAAKDYDPKLPKYFSTFLRSALYFNEDELATQHIEAVADGLRKGKIQYQNALGLIDQTEDSRLDLSNEMVKRQLAPLKKAVEEKTEFEAEDIEKVKAYAEFTSKSLKQRLKDHSNEMKQELESIFGKAHANKQTENAIRIRELQIAASKPGKDRAKAKIRLWHYYRSIGQSEKGLSFLNCEQPNVMSEKVTSTADSYEVKALCYHATARSMSGTYESAAMIKLYKKIKRLESQISKDGKDEAKYYLHLTKFEIERSLLDTKAAKASFELIKDNEYSPKGKFLMGTCDKAIELYSIFSEEGLDVEPCITELEKALKADPDNISHYAFALRNLSQHYRQANDADKAHAYAIKALEATEKNSPDHGVLKHTVYLTAAQSHYIAKKPNDALAALEKVKATIKGSRLEERLAKYIRLHEELFTRKKDKDEFVKEIQKSYGDEPVLKRQVDTMVSYI